MAQGVEYNMEEAERVKVHGRGAQQADDRDRINVGPGRILENKPDLEDGLQLDLIRLNEMLRHNYDIARYFRDKLEPILSPEESAWSTDGEAKDDGRMLPPLRQQVTEMMGMVSDQQRQLETLLKRVEL